MLEAKNLIEGLLKANPEERLTVPEILSHPWLTQEKKDNNFLTKDECINNMEPMIGNENIDSVNIEMLFSKKRNEQLPYMDYCYIANDFYTQHINEEVLKKIENMGYPKSIVISSLQKGELNHAVATYNLLDRKSVV